MAESADRYWSGKYGNMRVISKRTFDTIELRIEAKLTDNIDDFSEFKADVASAFAHLCAAQAKLDGIEE